jgi:tocopherol O-methyltransferase
VIASTDEIPPELVASHYDELDCFYRDVWGEHVHHGLWLRGDESRDEAVRQLVEWVARVGQIGPGIRVCDIGCGYGATARMLVSEFGAKVTGITVSPAQQAFAREQDCSGDYRLGDWLKNELSPESFDTAIAIESSEHMPDLAAFFEQSFRVLRPGGGLVVCAWLSAESPSPRARRWLLEPICREGRMPQMATAGEYGHMAKCAGFTLEHFDDLTSHVARTWPIVARQFLGKLLRQPSYARFLLNRHARNRVFALTLFRLCLAYRTGAMRYGIFTLRKPAPIL